jgi:hypothetical protein
MPRRGWKPFRVVVPGKVIEVSSAEFHAALDDFLIRRCDEDRRKGYLRSDIKMYRDAQTGQTRFAVRNPAPHDPYGIPSFLGILIRRYNGT